RRTPPSLVVMGQELGFVGGDVDADGTLGPASLAREAEIERLLDVLVLPAIGERIASQHLEQQVRAAARRMRLLARHLVTRTHRAAVVAAAFPDADAAERREREAATVVLKREMRGRLRWAVIGAEAQVLVGSVRIDDLARIHFSLRVPDRLELPERVDQLGTDHLRQELRPRLAVAV